MRIWVLLLALLGLSWFQFGQTGSAAALAQRTLDLVDNRPARSILILGNSRTFYNDMPAMLRRIADSANSPTKFQIESNTKPGFTLQNHWNDSRTRRLLGGAWDEVVIQGESGAQASLEDAATFEQYGAKLAPLAQLHSGRPVLVVAWPYDPSLYDEYPSYDRAGHLRFLQDVHADLARRASLEPLNLASLWESVRRSHPAIRLTSDGNHPTVAGTYLYALTLYRHLSQGSVMDVTFSPEGLSAQDAEALRRAVDSYPLLTP